MPHDCHILFVCCVVVDVQDSTEVVGTLKVTVEALEALRSIMDDPDHDHFKPQSER